MTQEAPLPPGWATARLSECCDMKLGKMLSAEAREGGTHRLPYLRNQNVRWGWIDFSDLKVMGFEDRELEKYNLKPGDLLMCEGGEPGRCAVFRGWDEKVLFQKALHRIRPLDPGISTDFLQRALQYQATAGIGMPRYSETTIKHLTSEKLREVTIRIPPSPEQRRIVDKIEELLSQLDAAAEVLQRAQAKLERYRAAVLKAAVEGRLTEAWRGTTPPRETAEELLERILAERRARWEEEQLAKYEAKGKNPPKNWQAKYKEPVGPDVRDLTGLPDGWCWATVEQVFINHDGKRVPLKWADRDQRPGPYPYYGASGIIDDIDDYLFDGTFLLLAEDGANLVTRSKPIAFQASGRFWVNNHAHVLEPSDALDIGYAEAFFNGLNLQFHVTGSAQPKLPQRTLNRIPIPIPARGEQEAIVELLGRTFDASHETTRDMDKALGLSSTVRQSILKRAFEGRLAPQNSGDEPASVLLERMRVEREAGTSTKLRRGKKTAQPALDL